MNKVRFLKIILFIMVAIGFVVYADYERSEIRSMNKEYFDHFSISFSGKIISIEHIDASVGLLEVNLFFSTTEEFDQTDSLEHVYCVIKGEEAKIIENGIHDYQIGDSIVIDGKNRLLYCYRYGQIQFEEVLYIHKGNGIINPSDYL